MEQNPIFSASCTPLNDVSVNKLQDILSNIGMIACMEPFKNKGVNGSILIHCETVQDLQDISAISLPVAKALLSHVLKWKVDGVPNDLLVEVLAKDSDVATTPTTATVLNSLVINDAVPKDAKNDTVDGSKYPYSYVVSGLNKVSRHWNGTYVKSTQYYKGFPSYFIESHWVWGFDWVWALFYGCCWCPLKATQGELYYDGQQWVVAPGWASGCCGCQKIDGGCTEGSPCGMKPKVVYGPNTNFPDEQPWSNGVSIMKV